MFPHVIRLLSSLLSLARSFNHYCITKQSTEFNTPQYSLIESSVENRSGGNVGIVCRFKTTLPVCFAVRTIRLDVKMYAQMEYMGYKMQECSSDSNCPKSLYSNITVIKYGISTLHRSISTFYPLPSNSSFCPPLFPSYYPPSLYLISSFLSFESSSLLTFIISLFFFVLQYFSIVIFPFLTCSCWSGFLNAFFHVFGKERILLRGGKVLLPSYSQLYLGFFTDMVAWTFIHHLFTLSFHIFSSSSSHPRSSDVNEVLIFNVSSIDLAPSSPIWFPVHFSFLFILFSFSFNIFFHHLPDTVSSMKY